MEFPQTQIETVVRRHLSGLANIPLDVRPIKTGKFNSSYKIMADGQAYVLRIAPPRDAEFVFYEREMMRQEPELHAILRRQTSVPVPQIIAFDDSLSEIGRDYLLMACMPGAPLTDRPMVKLDDVLFQIGEMLAQVHAIHAEWHGYLGAHRPMNPQPSWVLAFETMWQKMSTDNARVGYYDQDEVAFINGLFNRFRHLFDRPIPASLCHMDVWHQNILVDEDGTVTGLIDWDRALWGDPEIEFAVLDYCGLSGDAFWAGYGRERDTSVEAQIRQRFYLLYEMQKYILIRHGRENDPVRAMQHKRAVWRVAGELSEI